ncbi:hypothetical protein EDC04DRAFT_2610288 [Pisolithus marmoratus]|nr:hypothetical protein EDC04DRAFT_2610288 [Pisolithus marmoratus]
MVEPGQNPHEAIQPDFAAAEHALQRQLLTGTSLMDDQAVALLSKLWTVANDRDKDNWDACQAELAHVRQEVDQAAEEENVCKAQEEEELHIMICSEECKKYKSKYTPVTDALIPIGLVHIPSQVALTQMKKGEYVELWYFSNKGIRAAEASTTKSSRHNDSFVFVHDKDADAATLVPASSVTGSCSSGLIEDVDLSWEEFMQASPCMIESMEQSDWPQDRINMFIEFWSSLENHPWRHSDDAFSQKALLVYQGVQRKRWHIAIGTKHSWSLVKLCRITLAETCQRVSAQSSCSGGKSLAPGMFSPPPT